MQLGSHNSHNVNAGHAADGEDVSNAANATQLRSASSAAFPEPARSLGTLISHNYNYDRDVTVTSAPTGPSAAGTWPAPSSKGWH